MKISVKILILFILIISGSCVSQFIPETNENREFLVVEGLITNQNRSNVVLLSKSSPLNTNFKKNPVTGGIVSIADNFGNTFSLIEKKPGMYVTDSLDFLGVAGRKYILYVIAEGLNYMSDQMEMKNVPPIDTVQSEKIEIKTNSSGETEQGYQVYVSTHDPSGESGYYRWEYTETWEYHLPYNHQSIVNRICWKSDTIKKVLIKTTTSLSEDRVVRFPVKLITTETDRLTVKYSMLLKQYSINEVEYLYWDKIRKINEETGGLYDVVPISVKSNIRCVDDPSRDVLGYFSVSAVSEKRIFINPQIDRYPDYYKNCINDTIPSWIADPRIGVSVFILMEYMDDSDRNFYIITYTKGCHDCSLTGSTIKPDFWENSRAIIKSKDNFDIRK